MKEGDDDDEGEISAKDHVDGDSDDEISAHMDQEVLHLRVAAPIWFWLRD